MMFLRDAVERPLGSIFNTVPHPEALDAERRASKDATDPSVHPSRPASRAPQDEE
jgi:hypothetical protein